MTVFDLWESEISFQPVLSLLAYIGYNEINAETYCAEGEKDEIYSF